VGAQKTRMLIEMQTVKTIFTRFHFGGKILLGNVLEAITLHFVKELDHILFCPETFMGN
jgi:hypothetical protein